MVLLGKGWSSRAIARVTEVSPSVQRVRKNQLPHLRTLVAGRPCKFSDTMMRACIRAIMIGSLETASAVAKVVREQFGWSISIQRVRQALNSTGLQARTKKKKPLFRQKNITARLEFALANKHWTINDWKRVIFSDETKTNRFTSNGRYWYWALVTKDLTSCTMQKTIKLGGGSMMVWRCMIARSPSLICRIEGRMNQHVYCAILESKLNGTFLKFGFNSRTVIFQQDNDPKHTAKTTKEWLLKQLFSVIKWPLQSPDLNPIEHLWFMLKWRLNQYPIAPIGLVELWERVLHIFNNFTIDECNKLYGSMPRWMKVVIYNKGKWTSF